MEENNFNNNPINNELPQQPVLETEVQPVQEPTVQAEVQPAPQPIESNIEINPVVPETPQISVSPAPAPVKKSGNNKTGLMAVLVLVVLMAAVVGVLFATGKLDFGKKEGTVEQPKKTELNYKTVNNVNLTKSSNTKFNGMTVEIVQSDNPTGAATSSVKVNGTEIVDKVNIGGVYSYTIYYDYIIFYSIAPTKTQLSIYNPKDGSVVGYTPTNSFGYMINSYYVSGNKIIMNGVNVAKEYKMSDPGYSNAELEVAYVDGKLGGINIIKKYNITTSGVTEEVTNSSVSYKTVNNIKGSSTITYNNITVSVVHETNSIGIASSSSVKVNGTEIVDKVNLGYIEAYTIFNEYVIFLSGNTSGHQLSIYNTKDGSSKTYDPTTLFGYGAYNYEIGESKIILPGVNVSGQYGVADRGYDNADIEIVYSNGTFGEPKIVKEYNRKSVWKGVSYFNGNSRTIFNNIDVFVQQTPDSPASVCKVNSILVNNKEIKEKLSNLCVYSYTIVDSYVIFFIGGSSLTELRIYDYSNDSIINTYNPKALEGYMVKDYSFLGDMIVVDARNAGEQVGIQNSGKDYAQFHIYYKNRKFETAKKVNEYNESDIIR